MLNYWPLWMQPRKRFYSTIRSTANFLQPKTTWATPYLKEVPTIPASVNPATIQLVTASGPANVTAAPALRMASIAHLLCKKSIVYHRGSMSTQPISSMFLAAVARGIHYMGTTTDASIIYHEVGNVNCGRGEKQFFAPDSTTPPQGLTMCEIAL